MSSTSYTLHNPFLDIRVNARGAELCSVRSKQSAIEYIWQADPAVWARHAPVLFPIVGKLKNNSYYHAEEAFNLPQHGFARDREFTCIEQRDNELVFELSADAESLAVYPFEFTLRIHYLLCDNSLQVQYVVLNQSREPLFFSIGTHPAFNCPLQPGEERFSDYDLEFVGKDRLQISVLEDGLLTTDTRTISLSQNKLPVSKALFANDAIVLLNSQVDTVRLVSRQTEHGVALTSNGWPCYGIWSKKDNERFVCLEPWYGVADSVDAPGELSVKKEIIHLGAEGSFACDYTMEFF